MAALTTTPISIGAPQPWPSSSSSSPPSSSKAYNYNYDCSLSLCSVNCPQFCGVVLPPPPPPLFINPNDGGNDDDSSSSHISPLMAALIAVLAAAFLLLFYFTVISKLCRRRRNQTRFLDPENADRIDSLMYDPTRATTTNESGLDDSFIRQITVFKFRREDKLVDGTECAVCLTEFNEDESLRLMPNCEHAFHLPCIDTWLKTHSNCPLCRSTMNPVPVPNPNPNPTARSSVGSVGPAPNNNNNNAATASVAALRVQRSNDAVLVIRELESRVQVVETTADDEVGSRVVVGRGGECRNFITEDNNINININISNNRDTKLEINNNNNNNNNHRNSR